MVRVPWQGVGDVAGETMSLRINGLPVFLRGANLVPPSPFLTVSSGSALTRLLGLVSDARAAGFNLLRVWGGGWYLPDSFYNAADRAGLMVWQEGMFACSPYPVFDWFSKSVEEEVREQATRIAWRPGVVVWGGNNEVEQSLEWFPETLANLSRYKDEYIRLFLGVMGGTMQALRPALAFVDSSPSNGIDPATGAKRWGDPSGSRKCWSS